MKLSQMNTDQVLDLLCQVAEPVANIAADEKFTGMLGKTVKKEDITRAGMIALGVEKLVSLVPMLLKDHREDIYLIVAAVNGKDAKEIASQNVLKTIKQVYEIVHDKELIDFFGSLAQQEQTA